MISSEVLVAALMRLGWTRSGKLAYIADGGFSHDYDLSAYAFFVREGREDKRAIDVAVNILGERYGYPDDAPQDDEDNTEED